MKITINIEKAKTIAHAKRRYLRELEFAPHDQIIAKQIPGDASVKAEAARKEIREKYAVIQNSIDAATSFAEIKESFSK
jgi:hypothetical protein